MDQETGEHSIGSCKIKGLRRLGRGRAESRTAITEAGHLVHLLREQVDNHLHLVHLLGEQVDQVDASGNQRL